MEAFLVWAKSEAINFIALFAARRVATGGRDEVDVLEHRRRTLGIFRQSGPLTLRVSTNTHLHKSEANSFSTHQTRLADWQTADAELDKLK